MLTRLSLMQPVKAVEEQEKGVELYAVDGGGGSGGGGGGGVELCTDMNIYQAAVPTE